MQSIKFTSILLVIFAIYGFSESLVRIPIEQHAHKKYHDIDIAAIHSQDGTMDIIVPVEKIPAHAEIIIPDLNAHYLKLKNSNYFNSFHSPQQIAEALFTAAKNYPEITELYDVGDSYNKTIKKGGHDIWAIKISDKAAEHEEKEADILFFANMHAREIITPEVLLYFMNYLLENYNTDGYVTHLINQREIWIIPTLNPDGLEYVFTGEYVANPDFDSGNPLTWRKNMADNNANSIFDPSYDGVDLNRNFGYAWGYDNFGSSPHPYRDTFRGPAAFSEPESQAILFLTAQIPFRICMSYHSYGNFLLYPWGYKADYPDEPALSAFRAMADSVTTYNGYASGNSVDLLYQVNGDTDDWLFGERGIFAFTPEVGSRNDNFWPDTTRVMPLVLENNKANLYMAYAAGEEPILHHNPLDDVKQDANEHTFYVTIEKPVLLTSPVALQPESFQMILTTRAPQAIPLEHVDGNQYKATLDLTESGEYDYYFEASDQKNRIGRIPRGAPIDVFTYSFTSAQVKTQSPIAFQLRQNYPNPFNSGTNIHFTLDVPQHIRLSIYDITGRLVKTLTSQIYAAGGYTLNWNGLDMTGNPSSSGIYMCRLQGEHSTQSIKLSVLR